MRIEEVSGAHFPSGEGNEGSVPGGSVQQPLHTFSYSGQLCLVIINYLEESGDESVRSPERLADPRRSDRDQ